MNCTTTTPPITDPPLPSLAALTRGWMFQPPPLLTVSQWADRHRRLSSEASAEPGQWRTDRAPYQRGIMDALNDPAVHTVVVMKSAQVGYTEILLNILGYYISQDPSPILLVNPTLEMSEVFSKTRLAPMLRDTPVLRGLVADAKSRDSGNTLLSKNFPGGVLAMAGANSPAGLASRPIRIVLCDEVDRFPPSAGAEGDPVNLAIKRSATFQNRKIILGSTPTIKGLSRIESAYEHSDRRRYHVPCPDCGEMQPLVWSNITWTPNAPDTAGYACRQCGSVIAEKHKGRMLARGEWRAETVCNGVAGFHLNELYSPWRKWSDVVTDFLAAKENPETLKTWVNTSLGETWEEQSEKSDPTTLLSRRENYTAARLPMRILYLTAGVDVQDDRLELEIIGWRQDRRDAPPESWGVEYLVLRGDPARAEVWNQLDEILLRGYRTEDHRTLRISACCVDSGGHHTAQVYAFCTARIGRHIYAIKGMPGARPIWSHKAGKSKKYQAQVWHVGSDTAKDAWYSRLRTSTENTPGYCHFPNDYTESFFEMLTAEQVRTKYSKGRPIREWFNPPGRRNEALDIRVYALAALLSRPVPWDSLAKMVGIPPTTPAPESPALRRQSVTRRISL